jgi:diguanylate cyclase (GGDEF)-like protein
VLMLTVIGFSLALSVLIGVYALFHGQSNKRNYFLLMQCAIFIYLIGYLLEITSTTAEAAFTAVKISYMGGFFLAPFAFFFVTDYCDIKLNWLCVKMPIILLSVLSVLAMWTTGFHGLVYVDYWLDLAGGHHLIFTPGPLYFVIRIFIVVCIALILGAMLYTIKKWKSKYRKGLIVFFFCALIPSITEITYLTSIMTGLNPDHINFTPYSLSMMSFFLYAGVMRFNVFEIISAATISAMDHIKEGFVLVDDDNNYLASNPAAAELFPEILNIQKGEPISSLENWPEELWSNESDSIEFCLGIQKTKYFRASINPAYTQNKSLMAKIIIFTDITDHVNLVQEMKNAACIDGLTGLFNRKHFSELAAVSIKMARRSGQPIYAGMLDIDFFKKVNDTYGHAAGDAILKSNAAIIRQTIRSYDLVGRYGGEEFSFLITGLEAQEAIKLAERIRENTEKHITAYEGVEMKVTCSIGFAQLLEGDSLDIALKKADVALYAAKHAGRNQVKTFENLMQGLAA